MPELFGEVDDRNSPLHLCHLAGVAISNWVGVPGVVLVLQGEPCFPSWPKREAIEESLICEDCLCGILIKPCWHWSPMHCGQGSDEGADRLAKCCHEYSVRSGSAIGEINVGMFYLSISKGTKNYFSYQVY